LAKKQLVTKEFLNYCKDMKEYDIISTRIETGSNRKTAKKLNICKTTVDRVVRRILDRMEDNYSVPLVIKGTSTLYDADGNVKLQWVKTDKNKEDFLNSIKKSIDDIIIDLRKEVENASKHLPRYTTIYQGPNELIDDFYEKDIITIYPIGDLHLGMLSWDEETGENYDTKISYELLLKAFKRMIDSSPNSETAILANLGDFFHIDDTRNETLKSGNRLDVDSRYPKILKTGLKLITEIIEMLLKKHDKIIIRNAIGNHDPHTSYFLNEYIKAWFNDSQRLIIEDSVKTFWFYKFGKNLIGITHGDTCKMDHLPEIMASDAKEYWSDTEFRYWYIGHVHHQQLKEYRTCQVESFGTLAAKDAWHSSSGYRSQRQIKFKVLHKDYGEIQENTINIKMLEE